jgi:NADPH:quinone reductase-like Zn-dependent oxidoreductase
MTTTNMRIYRLQQSGGPDGIIAGNAPIPVPASNEVLVRVRAVALNFRDLVIVDGGYPLPVPAGRVPVSDAAGEVVAVGTDVTRFKIGDRVTNAFFPDWIDGPYTGNFTQYAIDVDGWLLEFRAITAAALIAVPDALSFEEASTLPCAGVTAWAALKGVQRGSTVLTQGTGGVSLLAVQIAKALGAKVIATTSSAAKFDALATLGADHIINYREEPEWAARVRELTDSRGVDRIVEVGGPGTFAQSVKAVSVGGQVSMVGVLAGMQGSVDYMSMFASQARFQPIAIGSRHDLADLADFVVQHGIHPHIDSRWKFEDARLAFKHLGRRDVFGKVVITL